MSIVCCDRRKLRPFRNAARRGCSSQRHGWVVEVEHDVGADQFIPFHTIRLAALVHRLEVWVVPIERLIQWHAHCVEEFHLESRHLRLFIAVHHVDGIHAELFAFQVTLLEELAHHLFWRSKAHVPWFVHGREVGGRHHHSRQQTLPLRASEVLVAIVDNVCREKMQIVNNQIYFEH